MTDTKTTGSLFTMLVFIALVLTLAAVVLSAYLRLESIGLGCEGWPACFGQISEVQARGLVPATTAGAVHRLAATLLGVIVFLIAILALRGRRPANVGIIAPLLVFALTVFLSVLGYSTPSPDIPAVTLGNLGGGMVMLALLWWISQRSAETINIHDGAARSLKPWALLGLFLIAVQIALGALTSASFAGPSCSSLTGCNGGWSSMANLLQGLDIFEKLNVNDAGRIVTGDVQKTVHMTHRMGAIVTFIYLAWLAFKALNLDSSLRNTSIALLAFLLIQTGLGVASISTELPLLLVTAHNTVAALLLLAVVNLNHLLNPTTSTQG